ncbi:MAG: DUF1848 domain-containing protein [Lachnospiraceae bacterium]|nr:DUF1848 domain-containing protein [Lachnospiraceae bacterium]
MILSVSRRTDIPNYYSEWFYNRLKEGFVYVRNPVNMHQISKIDLSPEVVDCIVFWTKNPEPMMERLPEISAYPYYFQFTLTGYGKDIEMNVPHKRDIMINIFQKLSDKIGSRNVIWRYDPILFNNTYTPEYHIKAFGQIASALNGFTRKCVISFVDSYARIKKNMQQLNVYEPETAKLTAFSKELAEIAKANGITVASCAETINLSMCGIEHNCCIDRYLIEEIIGCKIKACKDKNQRESCGCMESIDIGTYHTCPNGCRYCYANTGTQSVLKNSRLYDPASPLLCGTVGIDDKISIRKVKSLKDI